MSWLAIICLLSYWKPIDGVFTSKQRYSRPIYGFSGNIYPSLVISNAISYTVIKGKNDDWGDIPDFSDNIPMSKRVKKTEPLQDIPPTPPSKPSKFPNSKLSAKQAVTGSATTPPSAAPIVDWRAAMNKPSKKIIISKIVSSNSDAETSVEDIPSSIPVRDADNYLRSIDPTSTKSFNSKPAVQQSSNDLDFDYDDFAAAMLEEEDANGFGGTVNIVKASARPNRSGQRDNMYAKATSARVSVRETSSYSPSYSVSNSKLTTGDVIDKALWADLVDQEGKPFDLMRIYQLNVVNDIMIAIADPRRFNNEFRTVLGNLQ